MSVECEHIWAPVAGNPKVNICTRCAMRGLTPVGIGELIDVIDALLLDAPELLQT